MAKSKLGRLDDRVIEPNVCSHGKVKVWKNKKRGCPKCEAENKRIMEILDLSGDRTAEKDDRGNLRKHRTAQFHLGKAR